MTDARLNDAAGIGSFAEKYPIRWLPVVEVVLDPLAVQYAVFRGRGIVQCPQFAPTTMVSAVFGKSEILCFPAVYAKCKRFASLWIRVTDSLTAFPPTPFPRRNRVSITPQSNSTRHGLVLSNSYRPRSSGDCLPPGFPSGAYIAYTPRGEYCDRQIK